MDSRFVISAYHNYMVNGSLLAGFQLGEISGDKFFFQAFPIEPEDEKPQPLVSANLFDPSGGLILRLDKSRTVGPQGLSKLRRTKSGFFIRSSDGKTMLSIRTFAFKNCYCTHIAGILYDERGRPVASGDGETFRTRADIPVIQPPHGI